MASDKVIYNSDYCHKMAQESFSEYLNAETMDKLEDKSRVLRFGLLRGDEPLAPEATDQTPVFLYNHRFEYYKRPDITFALFDQFRNQYPNLQVWVTQTEGQMTGGKKGYTFDKVIFHPSRMTYLQRAAVPAINTINSTHETFCISILDSMALGHLVVVPRDLTFPELFCHKIFLEHGGKSFTKHQVERVLIGNGRARGVRLTDGTEVEARRLVVSTLSPQQLCFQLIGEEHFQARTVRRLKHLSRQLIAITWYHWAVHQMPRYRAESFDPDIYKTGLLSLTTKDPEVLIRENAWRTLGKMPPDPALLVWCLSLLDPTQAPEGKHIVGSEQFVLSADQMSERQWLEFKKKNASDVIRTWQEYAPNMSWENVIGYDPLTPYDCLRLKNMGPTGDLSVSIGQATGK